MKKRAGKNVEERAEFRKEISDRMNVRKRKRGRVVGMVGKKEKESRW